MENDYIASIVCGKDVWYDKSGGQGHCWIDVNANNMPPNIADEITGEILDGETRDGESYRAANGQYYRWRNAAAE